MKRETWRAVLAALALMGSEAAAAQEIKDGICYAAEVPRSYGPVRSITARIDKAGAEIRFTEWDVPNTSFLVGAECSRRSSRMIHCSVECDGGHADLALILDGRLSLFAKGIRTSVLGLPSRLLDSGEADGGSLTGLYILRETAAEQCEPAGETGQVTLEAGDDTPAVAAAEALLNGLGFLLEKPDNIYSDRTADAVRQFQSASGLTATGIIDPGTARKLISQAAAAGGC